MLFKVGDIVEINPNRPSDSTRFYSRYMKVISVCIDSNKDQILGLKCRYDNPKIASGERPNWYAWGFKKVCKCPVFETECICGVGENL